jgi:hypothetical protein
LLLRQAQYKFKVCNPDTSGLDNTSTSLSARRYPPARLDARPAFPMCRKSGQRSPLNKHLFVETSLRGTKKSYCPLLVF